MNDNLLNKKEIMELLNISKGKLDKMIKNKQIPFYKNERIIRFNKNEVLNKLNNG